MVGSEYRWPDRSGLGYVDPTGGDGPPNPIDAADQVNPDLQEDRLLGRRAIAAWAHQDGQHCPLPRQIHS